MRNLNSRAGITETTKGMEKRGAGMSVYNEDEGWVRIDEDYKPKHPPEYIIKIKLTKKNCYQLA